MGYAVAPKVLIDEMEKLQEHMVSGVTAVAQRAALAAIQAPQDCVREMVNEYDRRRKVVHAGLNAIDGITCIMPESTFYAFANISRCGLNSWEFAKYIVREHKVAVVPGSIFGKRGEGFVRLSFAADIEQLQEAIESYATEIEKSGKLAEKRRFRLERELLGILNRKVHQLMDVHIEVSKQLPGWAERLYRRDTRPYTLINEQMQHFLKERRDD